MAAAAAMVRGRSAQRGGLCGWSTAWGRAIHCGGAASGGADGAVVSHDKNATCIPLPFLQARTGDVVCTAHCSSCIVPSKVEDA